MSSFTAIINGVRARHERNLAALVRIKEELEKSVADLEEIKNRPAKLNKKIETLKAAIAVLVKYMDEMAFLE